MSIDLAYDAFHLKIATSLEVFGAALVKPLKFKELDDNLIIENNDEKYLKNGFCVRFNGDSLGANTEMTCKTYLDQVVNVTFTTANFGTHKDTGIRKNAEKQLLLMKDACLAAIGGDPNLDGNVAKCSYVQSDPIETIFGADDKEFLMLVSTYVIGYYKNDTNP